MASGAERSAFGRVCRDGTGRDDGATKEVCVRMWAVPPPELRAAPGHARPRRLAGWPAVINHAERTPPARARGRRAHGTLRQLKKSPPTRLVVVQGTVRQRRSTHLDKAGTVVAHHAVHVAETHGATARRRYGDHRGEGLDKLAAEPRARRLSLDAELVGVQILELRAGCLLGSGGGDWGGPSSCQERCEELLC